ncbi:hypothetical protein ACFL5V_10675 [Fibrobacterota bacterium]
MKTHNMKAGYAAGLAVFLIMQSGWCVPGLNPDGSLDKETISALYFNGDFKAVVDALETFRKGTPSPGKEDRIFMYKYLSVIYASKPETKDKGESYMYQLLKLVPTVDLIDMYISDNIESIFLRVKERYQRMESDRPDPVPPEDENANLKSPSAQAGTSTETDQKQETQEGPKIKRWMWWTAGGVAVAGIVTVFLVSGGDNSPEVNTISNYE